MGRFAPLEIKMAKKPTNKDKSDTETQADLEAKQKAEQEKLEKARLEAEAQAEKARLAAEAEAKKLAAEQKAHEEELAKNKKTTITMINPDESAEPKEAEVHQDMVKHWEQEGWTVK